MKVLKLIATTIAAAALAIGFTSCKNKNTQPAPSDYGGGVADYSYTTGK